MDKPPGGTVHLDDLRRAAVIAVVIAAGLIAFGRLSGNGTVAAPDPLAGQVVFGDSFDTSTFDMRDPRATAHVGQLTSFVAHFSQSVTGGPITLTYRWRGTLIGPTGIAVQPSVERLRRLAGRHSLGRGRSRHGHIR